MSRCERVNFEIETPQGKFQVIKAITVSQLDLPRQTISEDLSRNVNILENVSVSPYVGAQPKILLGQDNWRLIVTREMRELRKVGLGASRSQLGWSLHGQLGKKGYATGEVVAYHAHDVASRENDDYNVEKRADDALQEFFSIDALGVRLDGQLKDKHERAREILRDTTRRVGNQWETGLLWKSEEIPLADSYATARRRLTSLEKRLDHDNGYAKLYYNEMQRFITSGYAKEVSSLERYTTDTRVWYLPHFGVRNINKPDKIRLVFDAGAKSSGVSLNDQLETGPDLLQSLFGILLRFRQYPIACKGDIRDMFLRVKVRKQDRSAQRFLWRGGSRDKEPAVFEMQSLIFGATSSPSSAIYVKDENAKQFSESRMMARRV